MHTLFIKTNIHIFFILTCFFIIGIISAAMAISFFSYILIFTINLIFLLFYNYKIHLNKQHLKYFFFITVSFVIGNIRYHQQSNPYFSFYKKHENNLYTITGTVIDIVSIEHQKMKQCLTIAIRSLQIDQQNKIDIQKNEIIYPANMSIQVYTPIINSCTIADTVQINAVQFKKPSSASFLNYLIKNDIVSTIFLSSTSCLIITERPLYSFWRWVFTIKQNIFERLRNKIPKQSFSLFSSLFLGNKSLYKKNIHLLMYHFKQWGIAHYLARSGLHLTIFSLLWLILFRFLPLSLGIKQIILIILGSIYALFSWPSISFLRAFYSFILYSLCTILKIPISFLHILTLITFGILFLNPIQLFFLDFQLSFALTFALALINHLYQKRSI